jgi:hypothetical protein
MNDVFASLNKWIKVNKLALYLDKTNFMQFFINNKTCVHLNIGYGNQTIREVETNSVAYKVTVI